MGCQCHTALALLMAFSKRILTVSERVRRRKAATVSSRFNSSLSSRTPILLDFMFAIVSHRRTIVKQKKNANSA